MSITGNLKTMQLAELLQWLSQSNKTGTLVIDDGGTEKKIFFRDGRVISSASTDPKEHLGHFLVSHGLIDEEELAKAIEMQERTGMLLGKILLTIGALEEDTCIASSSARRRSRSTTSSPGTRGTSASSTATRRGGR